MLDIAIVALYLIFLTVMGLRGGRSVKNAADFTAAGGRYGTAVIFASLSASFIGGGFSAGNAAAAFEKGIGTTLALLGFSLSMMVIGRKLVPGVARFTGAGGKTAVSTPGGIIEVAYGRGERVVTGLFSFFCCAGVVGAQLEAMGTVFHLLLGIPVYAGVLLGCGIVLVYTTFGGLQSVITADIIQFVLLAVGVPVLLLAGLHRAGGWGGVAANVPADFFNPLNGLGVAGFISLFLTMAVGEALAPPYTQRLLIGATPAKTARGTVLSGLFSIPFFLMTGVIGLTAFALGTGGSPDEAMPAMILTVLPLGLRGLVMAAMVSIMLSAADGFLNGAAIGLVCDTLLPLFPEIKEKNQLRWLRGVNLVTGLAALVMALLMPSIFDILVLAYSFWGPLILVPLAAALLGVRADRRCFRNAVLAGLGLMLWWNYLMGKPLEIDGGVVGLAGNLMAFAGSYRAYKKR